VAHSNLSSVFKVCFWVDDEATLFLHRQTLRNVPSSSALISSGIGNKPSRSCDVFAFPI
jgi:hypothetical protein